MIKLIYCFQKRPGMTDADFDVYWRDVHGPIAARIPGLRRLVQSRALNVPGDVRRPDYDGVAELWFDDVDALLAARVSEEWRRSGLDEANFIDLASAAYLVTEERCIPLGGA
ncbi:MAG: EthD domain-containing protein [Gemmatimonadaceae bacterium]